MWKFAVGDQMERALLFLRDSLGRKQNVLKREQEKELKGDSVIDRLGTCKARKLVNWEIYKNENLEEWAELE